MFSDGTRWIDPPESEAPAPHREPRARDLIATAAMAIALIALGFPGPPVNPEGPRVTLSPSSGAPGTKVPRP